MIAVIRFILLLIELCLIFIKTLLLFITVFSIIYLIKYDPVKDFFKDVTLIDNIIKEIPNPSNEIKDFIKIDRFNFYSDDITFITSNTIINIDQQIKLLESIKKFNKYKLEKLDGEYRYKGISKNGLLYTLLFIVFFIIDSFIFWYIVFNKKYKKHKNYHIHLPYSTLLEYKLRNNKVKMNPISSLKTYKGIKKL